MLKPREIREIITRSNPYLRQNPDKMQVFIDAGNIRLRGAGSLSYEYEYTLRVIVLMSENLEVIERWIGDLLGRLDERGQARVNRSIAIILRRTQSQRIGNQQNPDGTRYEPRKPFKNLRSKTGSIRRRGMFTKLRTQKYLKAASTASEISVGFRGRSAMIAMIHQYGLESRYKQKTFKMPVRQLLGLTDAELEVISQAVLSSLAGK